MNITTSEAIRAQMSIKHTYQDWEEGQVVRKTRYNRFWRRSTNTELLTVTTTQETERDRRRSTTRSALKRARESDARARSDSLKWHLLQCGPIWRPAFYRIEVRGEKKRYRCTPPAALDTFGEKSRA